MAERVQATTAKRAHTATSAYTASDGGSRLRTLSRGMRKQSAKRSESRRHKERLLDGRLDAPEVICVYELWSVISCQPDRDWLHILYTDDVFYEGKSTTARLERPIQLSP